MKHLKIYEQFELNEDPWGEDTPRKRTFLDWFQDKYGDKDPDNIGRIDCSNSQLVDLKGVEKLKCLQLLCCDRNHLENLGDIENLKFLDYLDCSHNELKTIEKLGELKNLTILICDNNHLTHLNGIENLKRLRMVYCFNNNFSDEYEEYLKKHFDERFIIY